MNFPENYGYFYLKGKEIFLILLKTISNRFNCNIKFFKTDNGLEFKNKKIKKYCLKNGITKLYSPPYNPENNGKAERFNQTLINCARTLLSWSKLDQKFWDYAINYANYLYNINPHRSIGNAIPNEVFFNKKVDLKYIKTFGCISYYKNFSQNILRRPQVTFSPSSI